MNITEVLVQPQAMAWLRGQCSISSISVLLMRQPFCF